jgi:hypothetical protein
MGLFTNLLSQVNNSQIRIAIERMFALWGMTDGSEGTITATVTGGITGDITGDVTGDILAADATKVVDSGADQANSVVTAGSLVGTLTGDVVGDLTGKAKQVNADDAPVNATAAVGTITMGGVVIDGETVTVDGEVFEFDADGSVTGANTTVDVSGSMTASTATMTQAGVALDAETFTINSRVYECDARDTEHISGDVRVDISEGGAAASPIRAAGTLTMHTNDVHNDTYTISGQTVTLKGDATAEDADNLTLRGLTGVVAATATFGLGGPVTDTKIVTLGSRSYEFSTDGVAGVGDVAIDLSGSSTAKDDALTAFETAVNGDGSAEVTAVKDLAANEITFTAIIHGTPGNSIVTTTDEPAGAFVAGQGSGGTMTGGANATATVLGAAVEAHLTAYPITSILHTDNLDGTLLITWDIAGVAGDAIAFTETLTGGSMDGATTLGGTTAGVDCNIADLCTALALAITNDTSAEVTAVADATTVVVTWKVPGTIGDGKVTAETGAQSSWGGNLAGGADCSANNASAALGALTPAGGTVTFVDATGSVTVTAVVSGTAANTIAMSESSANITVDATLNDGTPGVDGTVGLVGEVRYNVASGYVYLCLAANTVADANWRRWTFGNVY